MNDELGQILSPVTICLNKLCSTLVQLVNTLTALKIIILYVYGCEKRNPKHIITNWSQNGTGIQMSLHHGLGWTTKMQEEQKGQTWQPQAWTTHASPSYFIDDWEGFPNPASWISFSFYLQQKDEAEIGPLAQLPHLLPPFSCSLSQLSSLKRKTLESFKR